MKIHTELTNKEIEVALVNGSNDINLLWGIFKDLEGDKEFQEQMNLVKYGIDLVFDIRMITRGFYEELPQYHMVKLRRKERVFIYEFWDELEKRTSIMKRILRGLHDDSFDNQEEEAIEGYD